jgi:endonuclease III related protein
MASLEQAVSALQEALADHFGPAPDDTEGLSPFEAIVSVLLAKAVGTKKCRAALDTLREAELLTPLELNRALVPEISDALSENGLQVSAIILARLKNLAHWLVERREGRLEWLFDPHHSTGWLRGELASINGIGISGADAILLHALKQPSYPVDRGTFRVLVRHDWLDPTDTYEEARDRLVDLATQPRDPAEVASAVSVLSQLAFGMDQLGRRYCLAAAPRCDGCPLEALLPPGGPRTLDD